MNERKLIKVTMEYDNGDEEFIEEDDVRKWKDVIDSSIILAHIHGHYNQNVLKNIIWKKI